MWENLRGEFGFLERRGQFFEIWSFSPQLKQPSSLRCLGDGLRVVFSWELSLRGLLEERLVGDRRGLLEREC